LLLAALSEGNTRVDNLLESDDIRYMLEALDCLKVPVEKHSPESVTVTGQAGPINSPKSGDDDEPLQLFLGNAGTAMRPLAAALCMGQGNFVLDGVPRMRERPIADLIDGLKQLGADVSCVEETGCPPVTIHAKGLKGGKVRHYELVMQAIMTIVVPDSPPHFVLLRRLHIRLLSVARCHLNSFLRC
jgi:3-phosphoshikimate 1-carboxyvinyltransferase